MSIRDQLLKAGLVSKEKAKAAEQERRKNQHQQHKSKAARAEAQQQAEELAQQVAEKRAHDQALEKARAAERVTREIILRIEQILARQRLNDDRADELYFYRWDEHWIRRVRVTPPQRRLLAKGRLGLVRHEDPFDCVIVTREAALRIHALKPEWVLVLHDPQAVEADDLLTPLPVLTAEWTEHDFAHEESIPSELSPSTTDVRRD